VDLVRQLAADRQRCPWFDRWISFGSFQYSTLERILEKTQASFILYSVLFKINFCSNISP